MPSAFDLFGSFENSLRTYHKPQWRFKPCPHGIHVPEHCTCDPNHECKRPHCANDVPLDPTCRLSIGTPFGPMISITDSPPHKCHSSGCAPSTPTTPTKSPVPFAVVDRLYSTRTHASAAKMKGGGASHEDASDDGGVNGSVGGKSGSRLISQLIGDQAFGSHDRTRRDGASPSPTRRAQSIGVRRAATFTPADLSTPSRRSHSSHATVKSTARAASKPRRGRGSESDASSELSSSPETSPGSTPSPTPSSTPRKHLSPKNSGAQLLPARTPSIKRNAKTPYARPSAVFCGGGGGGRGKIKPTPLNKSASDGVERARSSVGLRSGKGKGEGLLAAGEKKILNDDLLTQQLHNKLARVSSDSRVDELLAQAYMALESLTPEPSAGGPVVAERAPASPHAGTDALRRLAIAHARKENGKSYKDLTQILQEKIQELDNAVARSEEQVAAARAWLDAERVWLVHRGGFCAARQLRETDSGEPLPEGRVRLKLEHNGDIIEVDEDDVEKANPPPYDRCEDLAQLRYLNESSVLHTLRQRYGSNLIHTYAGAAMVVINPTSPLAIYSEKARSEEQVAAARAWLDAERVWLVHRGGFCAARQLRETDSGEPLPEGRVRLKLEHNGDIIEVDEDDVEKANPPPYDRCEDLAQLRYLNESSVLHTLRQRYGSNLIHTYAGAAMVVINPTSPLAIYSEKPSGVCGRVS